jgi:hypothetical protein
MQRPARIKPGVQQRCIQVGVEMGQGQVADKIGQLDRKSVV